MFGHMHTSRASELQAAWRTLQDLTSLGPIRDAQQHHRMQELLNYLHCEVGENRAHPLSALLDIVVDLIDEYESASVDIPDASPVDVLRFLMEQHQLKQSDLIDQLGSQSVASEILRGKRKINARQAKALAQRFKVNATAFI